LQLVLIIDVVREWARDKYRPSILKQLKSLCTADQDDNCSITNIDEYSAQGEMPEWLRRMNAEQEEGDESLTDVLQEWNSIRAIEYPQDMFKDFATEYGIVRDARKIEAHLRGLYITRDNIGTLMKTFASAKEKENFAKSVLGTLSLRCYQLDGVEALNAIEEEWVGNARPHAISATYGGKVFVQFRISYFMSTAWEQVRELSYLAITEEARETLITSAKFRNIVRRSRFVPPKCNAWQLQRAIRARANQTVRDDFLSCLKRQTFSFERIEQNGERQFVIKKDWMRTSPGVMMQGIVHAIYRKYCIGHNEVDQSFLRIATDCQRDGRPLFPFRAEDNSIPSRWSQALVYGDILNSHRVAYTSYPQLCLWIFDENPARLDDIQIYAKLGWSLLATNMYGTTLRGRVYRNGRNWRDNLERHTYSIADAEQCFESSTIRSKVLQWMKLISVDAVQDELMKEKSAYAGRCKRETNIDAFVPMEGTDTVF
jgi:hypothetical protein